MAIEASPGGRVRGPVDRRVRAGENDVHPGFDPLRTERWIAVIRLLVVGVVTAIYVTRGAAPQAPGPQAWMILALAAVYGAWSVVAFADTREPSVRSRVLSILVDTMLVTQWIWATGGPSSEYWTLYLILILSIAMRVDLPQTVAASLAIALLYGGVVVVGGGLPWPFLLHRTSLMLISGFASGVLAQQRLLHRRRGMEFEELAEERSRELDSERAEMDRLRQVDVAKSEFVAVAAHDFRTPLAAVIGVLSTLREHGAALTTEERLELIDGAVGQATRLARLVDDLLTVSRIEDGVLRLVLEPVDPRELLTEAAGTSGMTGRLVIEIGRVGRVRCDQDAAIRVLTNLLDNARKYSPPDSRVHIKVAEESEMVRFSIRDEGTGIPEEERSGVFERFRRLDGGQRKPGSGLGLYICRGLVDAHGGTIRVDPASEGGAVFSFTLPRATMAEEVGTDAPVDDMAPIGTVVATVGPDDVDADAPVDERPPFPSAAVS
jgi:signal transduction histidine kinase